MHATDEIRKASGASLDFIATLLDTNEGWKSVMSCIPKDLRSDNYLYSDQYERKYNDEHVRLIEEHARNEKISFAKILFDEWGSSGQVRPTLQTLMVILTKAKMLRAADHLADALKIRRPPRQSDGPEAPVNVTRYLESLTSEQAIETRRLVNGTTNGTYENMSYGPTKHLGQSLQYPPTEYLGPISVPTPVLGGLRTVEISNYDSNAPSNLIHFSEEGANLLPSSQYLPNFPQLVKTESVNQSTMSRSSDYSDLSETYQSQNDITNHSASSQYSNNQNQIPSGKKAAFNWLDMSVDRDILQDTRLIQFKYSDLEDISGNFKDIAGSGGFGDIFKGYHKEHGLLAIKRSHGLHIMKPDLIMKIFNTEVISLSLLRHKNIVHILGYSLDGLSPCIVCEYIEGGSLLEHMKSKENRQNLNISHRMYIMMGTAEGLRHIHNTEKPMSIADSQYKSKKQYFVHGDVKSANILLGKDFVPKICDLGLAKQCSTTFHTESIMGTRAYMSHERQSGTITPKGDTYSYGIVLLELLTGLPPDSICGSDGNYDIKTYVEEKCQDGKIDSLLDEDIGEWPMAQKIFDLAKLCIKHDRFKRPTLNEICDILKEINNQSCALQEV